MAVKAAVLSAGYSSPWKMFPDYIEAPDDSQVEAAALARGDDVEYDYSDVEWEMPTDTNEDPEEALRLMQSMGANLSLSVAEEDDWEPEPVPLVEDVLALDDAEREWL